MKGKPIDLIVANAMHTAVSKESQIAGLVKMFGLAADDDIRAAVNENVARMLLRTIAEDATASVVYAALKACGAPCSCDDISEGMRAMKERVA